MERDPSDLTLESYESQAADYIALSPPPEGDLILLLDRVAAAIPGGTVLELGSGPGRDALLLEARGLRVQRTDATSAFVSRLRDAGYDARLLDARTDALGGPHDGIVANAVLLHLSRADVRSLFARVLEAVRPGGVLAFTVKEGDGEAWSDAKGMHRHFYFWREDELRSALAGAGWEDVEVELLTGYREPWLHVLARR